MNQLTNRDEAEWGVCGSCKRPRTTGPRDEKFCRSVGMVGLGYDDFDIACCLRVQLADERKMLKFLSAGRDAMWAAGVKLQEREKLLDGQIAQLADFIVAEVPGEPSRDDGAVDCAIRVMRAALAKTPCSVPVPVSVEASDGNEPCGDPSMDGTCGAHGGSD